MLRSEKIAPTLAAAPAAIEAVRKAAPRALDPWTTLGVPDLADVVRRICFLCGWTRQPGDLGRTLAITSPVGGEGKSSVASAMAISTARDHDGRVLLAEGDLQSPRLSKELSLGDVPGLTDVLAEEVDLLDAIHPTRIENLYVLPAGRIRGNPSRLLRLSATRDLLDQLRGEFAFVLLDLPPVLKNSDAAVLATLAERTVLVVRSGVTEQSDVQRSLRDLSGVNLVGVVVNRWRAAVPHLLRALVEQ